MIYVIATIELKENCKEAFLDVFRRNIPNVLAEQGCVSYEPMVDMDSGLPLQGAPRENVVTIMETWEGLEALNRHIRSQHMLAYREEVKDLVNKVNLQVLKPT